MGRFDDGHVTGANPNLLGHSRSTPNPMLPHPLLSNRQLLDNEANLSDTWKIPKASFVKLPKFGFVMSKEGIWVLSLTAANIFMFMLICWYKKTTED